MQTVEFASSCPGHSENPTWIPTAPFTEKDTRDAEACQYNPAQDFAR